MELFFDQDDKYGLLDIVEKDLFKDRIIYLNEDISTFTISNIVPLIHRINKLDEGVNIRDRKPLKIFISSYGGDAYAGWGVVSAIENSDTPIYTYVESFAMSMALPIFLAGHKRFLGKYATLLYHELRGQASGTRQEVKRLDKEYDRLQKLYDDYIIAHSSITQDVLDKHQELVNDWYIGFDDATKYKLYDDLI